MIKLNIQRFSSTNKTTHYDLSQYVSSDLPTYLVDYNSDMSKIDTGINTAQTTADTASTAATNAQTAAETAQTTANTAITNAATAQSGVNTNAANIGTLANLTTSEKTTIVGAINEVDGDVGNLSQLSTVAKNNLVNAINEVRTDLSNVTPELLWTNSNPSAQFAGQTLNIDITGYTHLLIVYQQDQLFTYDTEVEIGFNAELFSFKDGYIRIRDLNTLNNTVTFGDGYIYQTYASGSINNFQCIPYKIYGLKK